MLENRNQWIHAMLLLLAMASCTSRTLSPEALEHYLADEGNGLKKTVKANGIDITVTYKPSDTWVAQEVIPGSASVKEIDSLRKKYSKSMYFILGFSRNGKEAINQLGGGAVQFSEVLQTLSYRMPTYTSLTTSAQDTIALADAMLNRTFGMSAATEVLLVFDTQNAQNSEWVQLNINEFGMNTGNQRFRFEMDDLETAPKIDFTLK